MREEGEYVAMVAFRSLPDAEEALLHLDGRVIGGVSISARLDVMNGRNDEVARELPVELLRYQFRQGQVLYLW